jgi:hypothetical protein
MRGVEEGKVLVPVGTTTVRTLESLYRLALSSPLHATPSSCGPCSDLVLHATDCLVSHQSLGCHWRWWWRWESRWE